MSEASSKPALKICHLADVHLGFRRYQKINKQGFNQREADVSNAFREAIDRLIDINPDLVLIAGDLFHAVRPSNHVITFAFQQIRRLVQHSKTEIVIIAGNHESPKRVDTGSILRLFTEIKKVHVADTECKTFVVCNNQVQVFCCPHLTLQKFDSEFFKNTIDKLSNSISYQILVAHAQVDASLAGEYGAARVNLTELRPHTWDYIALGHVHAFTELSYNAAYSGALEHTSGNAWQDAHKPKGIIEFRLPERTLEFHKISAARELVTLPTLNALELTPSELLDRLASLIDSVAGGISGKIVRLQVCGLSRATLRNIDYTLLRKLKAPALHFQLDFRVQDSVQQSLQTTIQRYTVHTALEQYFNDNFTGSSIDSKELQTKLVNYLNRVEQASETA